MYYFANPVIVYDDKMTRSAVTLLVISYNMITIWQTNNRHSNFSTTAKSVVLYGSKTGKMKRKLQSIVSETFVY